MKLPTALMSDNSVSPDLSNGAITTGVCLSELPDISFKHYAQWYVVHDTVCCLQNAIGHLSASLIWQG